MIIRCQMSEAPATLQLAETPSQQSLSRSKSLNDISLDSQISAFAANRFIDEPNSSSNNNNSQASPARKDLSCVIEDNYYGRINSGAIQASISNHCYQNGINFSGDLNHCGFGSPQLHQQQPNGNPQSNSIPTVPGYISPTFEPLNLDNNSCSRPSAANMYGNLCGLIVSNPSLNGLTQQIENLHL